jgi:hypothetical protein
MQPEMADYVQSFLCMSAFTESLEYPCTAKYHLSEHENIPMELYARSADRRKLTHYQRSCIDQMKLLADAVYAKATGKA